MEQLPRRRRRPALACLDCRRRKIKCDRNDPCAHCVSTKTQCTYMVLRNENEASNQQRGSSLGSTPAPSAPRDDSPNILISKDIHPPTRTQNTNSEIPDVLQRVQNGRRSSASSSVHELSENVGDVLTPPFGLHNSQIILNKTRMLRWSHFVGTANEFAPIISCFTEASGVSDGPSIRNAETKALIAEMGSLLQKCKHIAKCMKVGRPSRTLSCPDIGLVPPSRELADTMATLYFRSFESTHRILHVPTFWTEYQKLWMHPEAAPISLRLRILLVIGIGSSLYKHEDTDFGFRNMVHQWIYAAQAWLSGPLEKDRLDIAGIQIHCLTMLARQIFSIGGDLVWVSMGSLMHAAMQIGFHRDPKYLPPMSVLQAELRRRLWATILELVAQSSLDSAMPPRISHDEFDTEPPSNINDGEMDESTTVLQPHPKTSYTTTSIQLILLDSLPTRLRILRLLNSLHSELSYLEVLALSSKITDKYRACSIFMKDNENSGVTAFHRNLLDYLLRRFLIPLHCPFANKARTNPLFHYSLKVSLDTAMSIISPEPDEYFSRLMALGGGFFREGFRYACSIISLELVAQVGAQRLDGALHWNSQHRDILKQAVKNMIVLSAERIRQGETNIKAHMFLSMVIAQTEAIEADMPCEFKIAQGGRDSLEFCHGLLQEQLGTASLQPPIDMALTPTSFDGGQLDFGLDLDFEFFMPDAAFS